MVRVVVGYLRLLTAIAWFGTILYVHVVLKPSYAARGLPRAEAKLGPMSMVVMVATGTLLGLYHVPSLSFLFETTFGILLTIKVGLFLLMVASGLCAVLLIGPRLHGTPETPAEIPLEGDLTMGQLARCEGIDGHPASIAHQGEIYDVTHIRSGTKGSRPWHTRRGPSDGSARARPARRRRAPVPALWRWGW